MNETILLTILNIANMTPGAIYTVTPTPVAEDTETAGQNTNVVQTTSKQLCGNIMNSPCSLLIHGHSLNCHETLCPFIPTYFGPDLQTYQVGLYQTMGVKPPLHHSLDQTD